MDMIADIAMPAAHWMELTCIRKSQGFLAAFGYTVKAIDPPRRGQNDLRSSWACTRPPACSHFDGG